MRDWIAAKLRRLADRVEPEYHARILYITGTPNTTSSTSNAAYTFRTKEN